LRVPRGVWFGDLRHLPIVASRKIRGVLIFVAFYEISVKIAIWLLARAGKP
jgi:hypothetical protein